MLRSEGCGEPGQLQPGHDHDRPEFADSTYVEPVTPEFVEKVIVAEQEKGG